MAGVYVMDSHEANNQSRVVYDKVASLILIGSVSFLCGIAPLVISRLNSRLRLSYLSCGRYSDLTMSCVLCVGSGVLLATVFTHMLPEIRESFDLMMTQNLWPFSNPPPAEFLLISGFLMIYLIEEIAILLARRRHQLHHPSLPFGKDRSYDTFHGARAFPEETSNCAATDSFTQQVTESSPSTPGDSSLSLLESRAPTHICGPHQVDAHLHALRAYLVVLAISVHALFEGLAVALERNAAGVWALTAAILTHKCVINACVGEQLVKPSGHSGKQHSTGFVISNILVLSLSSSLGILLGLFLDGGAAQGTQMVISGVLQALAAGTILYVLVFELLVPERAKEDGGGMLKFTALLLGCGVVILIQTQVVE